MAVQFSIWTLPPLLACGVAAVTARYAWTQRGDPGGLALWCACVAGAVWAALQMLSLTSTDLATKVLIERASRVPEALLPLAWLALALGYSGRGSHLRRWRMGIIYLIPVATIALVWTNERHHLVWKSAELAGFQGIYTLAIEHGPWLRVHAGYAVALSFVATVILALHIAQSPRHWWRLLWVFVAPVAVLGLNALYLTDLLPRGAPSPTPLGVSVGLFALAVGLMRRSDVDVAPVARSTVVEEMRECVIVVDRVGRCVDVNRAATELLGIRPGGEMPVEVGVAWAGRRKSEGESSSSLEELEMRTVDGETRCFDLTITRLGPRGGRNRSVLVLRDVTETVRMRRKLEETGRQLRDANEQLKHLANTDELTGLPNRRSFLRALERELGRAERYEQPLALVLLDLDDFKRINDTWGHPVGDSVLQMTAEVVWEVCRDSDMPGRIGGEELAVLLVQTGSANAELVAERLRRRIAEMERPVRGHPLHVTASFGVATAGPGRTKVDEIIAAADEALYRAKAGGRNRVDVAPDPGAQTAIDFGA
ncbi:MAG: diguanylate cyclase [Longimicrobiales bacterium]|nr:diguanylate cyclase [Longimicrobiales bacterium]